LLCCRDAFKHKCIQVAEFGCKLKLSFGQGNNLIGVDLFEATAALRKTELQEIIFKMADRISVMEASSEKDQQTIMKLRQSQGSSKDSGVSGMTEYASDSKCGKVKEPATKQPGMSLVNPGMRKRKIAKGVEFD
jgi:hypothetical protein